MLTMRLSGHTGGIRKKMPSTLAFLSSPQPVSNNENALYTLYREIHDRRHLRGSIDAERITFEAQKHRRKVGQEVSAQN